MKLNVAALSPLQFDDENSGQNYKFLECNASVPDFPSRTDGQSYLTIVHVIS